MDKKEARELLALLVPNMELLESEKLPFLTRRVREFYALQKEKEYRQWYNQIPLTVLEQMKKEQSADKFDQSCYSSFFPTTLLATKSDFSIAVSSYIQSLEQLRAYKLSSFPDVRELREQLEYIIKHERSLLLKWFQSKTAKVELERVKQVAQENSGLVDELQSRLDELDSIKKDTTLVLTERECSYVLHQIFSLDYLESDDFALKAYLDSLTDLESQITLNSKQQLVKNISDVWDELKEEQTSAELKAYPVDFLRHTDEKLTPLVTELATRFTTVQEVLSVSDNRLREIFSFSEEAILSIKAAISTIFEQEKASCYPRLKIDKLKPLEFKFIGLLRQYRDYPESLERWESRSLEKINEMRKRLEELVAQAPNRFRLNFVSDREREEWLATEVDLYGSYDFLLKEGFRHKQTFGQLYSDEELKQDFVQNGATYYALIEKLTGSKKSYTPNDLPSFIVDKVKQVSITTDGLAVTMRSYQEFGVQYTLFYKNVLLGDEMGLGKTIQAISVANHLYHQQKKRIIVLSPLSVLENWNREVQKWSKLPTFIYRGIEKEQSLEKWRESGGILLTNYEQAKYLLEGVKKSNLDFLIVDEAHYIKNPEAQRTRHAVALSRLATFKLFMSGTPLENRLKEMKHLVTVLNPSLGRKLEDLDWDVEEFKTQLSTVYLRRKRKEVLDELPDMEVIELWSRFAPEQQRFYDEAVREGIRGVMKMRRAAFVGSHSEKLQQIIDICKEARSNSQKVLVFSFFKEGVLYRLQEELPNVAPQMISGDISPSQRQQVIDEFGKDPDQTVLLSQIDAGGVGLNIQSANIVILCEPQWKPSTEQQAISRVYRMGQLRDVIVYRLLTESSLDETLMSLLGKKTQLFNMYANDSSVAEAFDERELFENSNIDDARLRQKVFEIERQRLGKKSIS